MTTYFLVVTNPPQSGVEAERVAPILDLTPDLVRAKANYHVPEIWAASEDANRMHDTAAQLREAGCRVVVVQADELVSIPTQHRVRSFSFTDAGLVASVDGEDVPLRYEEPVVCVFCRPRESASAAQASRPRRSSGYVSFQERILEPGPSSITAGTGFPDETPFFDIYVTSGGRTTRFAVVQGAASFSGLGRVQPRAAANMELFVERCEDRFRDATVDRRLEGMRIRHDRRTKRVSGAEHRRGFSFASPGLNELLHEISPTLDGITQPELSSRLAYLTKAHAS